MIRASSNSAVLDRWLLLRISARFSVLRIKCWDQDGGRSEKCEPRTDKTFVQYSTVQYITIQYSNASLGLTRHLSPHPGLELINPRTDPGAGVCLGNTSRD